MVVDEIILNSTMVFGIQFVCRITGTNFGFTERSCRVAYA